MESTTGQDSNSESDISDSWALVGLDEDSSLEWNNEIGIVPRQYVFENNEVLRTSSRNDLSDEDSIEVVAEDHTDNLSDNDAQEVTCEKWIVTENIDLLKSKESINVEEDIPDVRHPPNPPKKCAEYMPLLTTVLILGIVGGISIGYSWGTYASQPFPYKDATSTQHTRALLTKLQNENLLLHSQLRLAHSSLKLATPTVPNFKNPMKLDIHKQPKEKPVNIDFSGMCTITDFIRQSSMYSNNLTKNFCLASDGPLQNEQWTTNDGKNNSLFSTVDGSLIKQQVDNTNNLTTKVSYTEPNVSVAVEDVEADKTTPVLSEGASFLHLEGLVDTCPHDKRVPHFAELLVSETHQDDVKNLEGVMDPRPYTKLRAIVEEVYTMFSLFGNNIQTAFPPKLELLSILPQNMAASDFSVESFTADNYEKITAFKSEMQTIAQKLFVDIETSINKFVHNIASKLKKFEVNSIKQICKLKRRLESSGDIGYLDWNTNTLFQKCSEYQQNGHDDVMRAKDRILVKDHLLESKEQLTLSSSTTPSHKKSHHDHRIKEEQGPTYYDHNKKSEHMQQQQEQQQYKHFESKDGSKFSHKRIGERRKKSRKIKNIAHDGKLKKHYSDIQQEETNFEHTNKRDQHEKEVQRNKQRDNNNIKMDEEHIKLKHGSHEKYHKKKTFNNNNKENNIFDKNHKKYENMKKGKKMGFEYEANKSGEWALNMARGRAEQRRRDHQSDWLFDRAESRRSSRQENNKEPYWHSSQDYTGNLFTSVVRNKTKTFKDQASKAWKDVKHRVKENVWRPIVDTAKTAKRAFRDLNNYRSCQE